MASRSFSQTHPLALGVDFGIYTCWGTPSVVRRVTFKCLLMASRDLERRFEIAERDKSCSWRAGMVPCSFGLSWQALGITTCLFLMLYCLKACKDVHNVHRRHL